MCIRDSIHDDSFDFEPINRVLFGVDTLNFLQHLGRVHNISFTPQEGQQYFDCVIGEETRRIWIADPSSNVVTGTVQNFIDHYIQEFSGKVDYVHGENIVRQLAAQVDNVGILLSLIHIFLRGDSMESKKIIIPKKSDDDYKVISIRIKGKTLESIENISLKTNRSRNEVINILLESGVSNTEISEE